MSLDDHNRKYYINHVTRATTREDPRSEADQATHVNMTPPQARRIELVRDAKIGFGFVAGSEKPVVVRSVTPNGPSHDKLFANDQILKVDGKDVRSAAQADVISLIKSATDRIELEVVASEDVQDSKNQHNRKSSLMSRTTRERRRSTPVSVRFADEPALVQVIGPMEPVRRSSVPLIPNVLKVFLENGQTRSFRYDSDTTVEEIFSSFSSKLDIKSIEHFSLILSGPKKGQVSYIQNNEKISEIYTNRNCSSVNCICKLVIAFVPKDHYELLSEDPNTFEYLYAQVSNRVVEGFYGMDLKYDMAIKLAALQIQQKAMEAAAGRPVKISVRQVEKEFGGLGKFVPSDLLNNMKEKELRKILDQQIKQNETLASLGERYMTSLLCKLHYLNLAVEMFSYGGRYFDAKLLDDENDGPSLKKVKKQHITVLINLKYGVSRVLRGKVNVLCQLAELQDITGFSIRPEEDNKRLLQIMLQEGKKLQLICTTLVCLDMIALITGYYKVYVDNTSNTPLPVENEETWPFSFRKSSPRKDAPDYYSRHRVVPDVWSYPSRFQISNTIKKPPLENCKPFSEHKDVFVDFSSAPPRYKVKATVNAISEESESEDVLVLKKTSQRQKGEVEIGREQETFQHDSLETENVDSGGEYLTDINDNDSADLVLLDEDHVLLETDSSFLKCTSEDIVVMDETEFCCDSETAAVSEEFLATRKRPHGSPEGRDKQNVALKSEKIDLPETPRENQEDLISQLIVAEELWQEESSVVLVNGSGNKAFETVSIDGSGSFDNAYHSQMNNSVHDERLLLDFEDGHEEISSDTEDDKSDENELGPYLECTEHSLGRTDINQNIVTDYPCTKISLLAKDSGVASPAVSEHDTSINTNPLQDRSTSPPRALDFDESNSDNEGIELIDYLENKISQGPVEQGGALALQRNDSENNGNESGSSYDKGEQSPETLKRVDKLELKADSCLDIDDFAAGEGEDLVNSVDSHHISLEFCEGSEAETVSTTSDDDESLWSLFPQYFRPSGNAMRTSINSVDLSLAEEDQYEEGINSPETEGEVALLSFKVLNARDGSTPNIGSKEDEATFLDNCDESSTASSEGLEETYEVNAEILSESEEVSEDSGYANSKENDKSSLGVICNKVDETSSSSPNSARCACCTNNCDISPGNYSNGTLLVAETKYTSDFDQHPEKQFLEKFKSAELSEGFEVPSHSSDALVKHNVKGDAEILSTENCSPKNLDDKGMFEDRSYSPSDWIIPSPPTPTPELQDTDIPIVSPPPLSLTPDGDRLDEELKRLIVPPPPASVDVLPNVSGIKIASPPPLDLSDSELERLMDDYDDVKFLSLTDDHKLAKTNGLVSAEIYDANFTEDKKPQVLKVAADLPRIQKESSAFLSRNESNYSPVENLSNSNQSRAENVSSAFTSHLCESQVSPNPPSSFVPSTLIDFNARLKYNNSDQKVGEFLDKEIGKGAENLDIFTKNDESLKTALGASSASAHSNQEVFEQCRRFPSKQKPPLPPKPRILRFRSVSGEKTVSIPKNSSDGKRTCKSSTAGTWYPGDRRLESIARVKSSNLSKETSSNNIDHSFRQSITEHSHQKSSPPTSIDPEDNPSRTEVNPRRDKFSTRSLSVTCKSPYVPAPYSTSRMQNLSLVTSPIESERLHVHGPTLCKINNFLYARNYSGRSERGCSDAVRFYGLEPSTFSTNSTTAMSKEVLLHKETHLSIGKPASHLHERCGNFTKTLSRNLSEDITESTVPKERVESPDLHRTAPEHHEDKCNSSVGSSPLLDSLPPPLPKSSPPTSIPSFDLEDFDNSEPLIETCCDDALNCSVESNTSPELTSLNKDLKFKLHSDSVEKSRTGCFERRDGDSTLSASLTLFSPCRERRFFSEDWSSRDNALFLSNKTKRGSLAFEDDDKTEDSVHRLEEFQIKAFRVKCCHVCEEGLSKVIILMNRLELCLNKTVLNAQTNGEKRNWLLKVQNNARFLACDVKVISSSTKRGSLQVVSAIKTSLDSLEKLVESCENTHSMVDATCDWNGRHIVATVQEVVEQYYDILCTVKIASFQKSDNPNIELLVKKTNAFTALIDSLIRALRRY
ncbi:uncharacterized protein LOC111341263 isoform X2 [Stylophora pistillata]|nr:uncharacterized protein LOC111341263 isoform X2 [Stylophora pistillata]